MEHTKSILLATLLFSVMALTSLGAVQAGDTSLVWRTMKPLYAVNFDAGRKHVLSYFLSKGSLCDLTVLITERPSEAPKGDEIRPLSTSRFSAVVNGGKTARFDTAEGKAFEYACERDARAMSVREVNQLAATSPSPQ